MKRPLPLIASFFLCMPAAAAAAGSPSFDCDVAASEVEQMICHDDELAAMDLELAHAFAAALARAPAQDVNELHTAHEQWLTQRNDCALQGDIRACTRSAYEARLGEL